MAVRIAHSILLVILVVAPWLFGSVHALTQTCLAVAILAALVCVLLSRLHRGALRLAVPAAIVPLVFALALGAVQLIPLDPKTAAVLSPVGAGLRDEFQSPGSPAEASLAAESGAAAPDRQPLSLYPASTRYNLALLTLGVAAFFLGAAVFHTPQAQLRLCFILAINGAALALFGIVQKLTFNHALYWQIPLAAGARPFGPFVNKNNAAGYLTLGLAAAIGTLVWIAGRLQAPPVASPSFPSPRRPTLAARLKRSTIEFFARLDARQLIAFSAAACLVAGIVCSLSRGAWIATAGALAATGLAALATRRRAVPLGILGLVAVAGIALALWVGMSRSASARLANLLDATYSPWHHWEDSSRAVPDFWRLGSGLGTYGYVYGPYQDHPRELWYDHAENQYLEALVEAGVPGLGLLLAMIALVAWAVWYVLRHDSAPGSITFAVVALFAVSAQVLHAFFDYGLYITANMLTFALVCGAVAGRAAQLSRQSRPSVCLALPGIRWAPLVLAVSLGAACAWAFAELRRAAVIEIATRDIDGRHFDEETPSGASADDLQDAIQRLTAALESRQDDAAAHRRMGILWMHLYRVRAFEQLQKGPLGSLDETTLWNVYSDIAWLHGRIHELAQGKQFSNLQKLRRQPVVAENLQPALAHFLLARRHCPLLAESHVGIGELLGLVAEPAEDGVHLERARRLAPTDPVVLYQSGLLDFNADRLHAAYASWKRSLTLLGDSDRAPYLDRVLGLTWQRLADLETVRQVLPDEPDLLIAIAQHLIRLAQNDISAQRHREIRNALAQRALEVLEQAELPEDERHHLRALAWDCREEYDEAIKSYDRAVQLRPRHRIWRGEYADLLERRGRIGEAIEQVSVLARMAPSDLRVRAWLWRLHDTSSRSSAGVP